MSDDFAYQPIATSEIEFQVFSSAIGFFALAWSEKGLRSLTFPVPKREAAVRETRKRHPHSLETTAGPEWVGDVGRRIQAMLAGGATSFDDVRLDVDDLPPFHLKVYREALKIPRGQYVTYGELARRVGSPNGARAVGQAMARNPLPLIVPCHRVLAADGGIGGFTAPGGLGSKQHLLALES